MEKTAADKAAEKHLEPDAKKEKEGFDKIESLTQELLAEIKKLGEDEVFVKRAAKIRANVDMLKAKK